MFDLGQYWWILLVLVGFCFCQLGGMTKLDKEEKEEKIDEGGFLIALPKKIDFDRARVTIVSGSKNITQIADMNSGQLWFNLPPGTPIDKVKIRTTGGKEYNYDQQTVPGKLLVDPIPCYDCSTTFGWRK